MWGWQPGAAALNSVLFVSQLSVETGALSPPGIPFLHSRKPCQHLLCGLDSTCDLRTVWTDAGE